MVNKIVEILKEHTTLTYPHLELCASEIEDLIIKETE